MTIVRGSFSGIAGDFQFPEEISEDIHFPDEVSGEVREAYTVPRCL